MSEPTWLQIDAIVATTHTIDAYGGKVKVDKAVLDKLAQAINSGTMPVNINHNPDQPMQTRNALAVVRERDDGEHEVFLSFEVDAEDWAAYEAQRDAAGAPGGMSFTGGMPIELPAALASDAPVEMTIAVDLNHFAEEDLVAAAGVGAPAVGVAASFLFQFSAESTGRVILEVGPFLWNMGGSLMANYLYDVLQNFVPSRTGKESVLQTSVERPDGTKKAMILRTSDKKALRKAVENFGAERDQEG